MLQKLFSPFSDRERLSSGKEAEKLWAAASERVSGLKSLIKSPAAARKPDGLCVRLCSSVPIYIFSGLELTQSAINTLSPQMYFHLLLESGAHTFAFAQSVLTQAPSPKLLHRCCHTGKVDFSLKFHNQHFHGRHT